MHHTNGQEGLSESHGKLLHRTGRFVHKPLCMTQRDRKVCIKVTTHVAIGHEGCVKAIMHDTTGQEGLYEGHSAWRCRRGRL